MEIKSFAISEGTLNLPDAWQDHSINVLKFPASDATLVITRAWNISPEEENDYLFQQLARIKQRMKKVVMGEQVTSTIAGQSAKEVKLSFENQHVMVYEQLAIARIEDHLLVLTFSRMTPFDADADALWNSVKSGMQLGV